MIKGVMKFILIVKDTGNRKVLGKINFDVGQYAT